ncbi:uncharacterized protein [Ptychodera flava]|uniref:uncharacterized protein n=1 Tax=Ptychodera flava TaxID=63121 RepID=UPI00396A4624
MGIAPSFPLQLVPINYSNPSSFTSTGEHQENFELHTEETVFEKITKKFFVTMVDERERMIEAKRKLQSMDYESYTKKYGWSESEIADISAQFCTFDQNQDGVIDFHELCKALDELGDHTSKEERRAYFDSVDDDNSGGIEFDEYLQLVREVMRHQREGQASGKLDDLCAHGTERAIKIRKLSVLQQMESGVF